MGRSRQFRRSDLFLVRLWAEEVSNGETEWHGKVQRTVSGETHRFCTWSELVDLLLGMVEAERSVTKTQPIEAAPSQETP